MSVFLLTPSKLANERARICAVIVKKEVCNGSVVNSMSLGQLRKHEFFFRHFSVKKTSLPCLLRGSLAYICSGLLIKCNMNSAFVDKISLRIQISCVPRENKGFGNHLEVNFVRIKIDSP